MNKLQNSGMGPRHLSTTWALLQSQIGQWFVSEVRYHDNLGQVIAMPKRSVPFDEMSEAINSIPDTAVEQQGPSTMRSWRYDTPVGMVS